MRIKIERHLAVDKSMFTRPLLLLRIKHFPAAEKGPGRRSGGFAKTLSSAVAISKQPIGKREAVVEAGKASRHPGPAVVTVR